MMVNNMGFLKFSIFCEKSCLSCRPDTSAGYTKNRCFFTRWIQRNPSEKTILSCSLTPRQFFPLVGTATLLKRQNAIIPKRIFQQRDPFFLCKKCDQALGCPSQTHFRTSLEICEFAFCEAMLINSSQLLRLNQDPARAGARWIMRAMWFMRDDLEPKPTQKTLNDVSLAKANSLKLLTTVGSLF